MHLSERSERRAPAAGTLGNAEARARVAARLATQGARLDADRVAIAASEAAILHALFYVLADAGEEVVVSGSALAAEVAVVAGLDVVELRASDGQALFDAVGERTRVVVVGAVDDEALEVLAEMALPIVSTDLGLAAHAIFASEHAPLVALVGEDEGGAWLAVLGPADLAEPLVTRLECHARVFFARGPG